MTRVLEVFMRHDRAERETATGCGGGWTAHRRMFHPFFFKKRGGTSVGVAARYRCCGTAGSPWRHKASRRGQNDCGSRDPATRDEPLAWQAGTTAQALDLPSMLHQPKRPLDDLCKRLKPTDDPALSAQRAKWREATRAYRERKRELNTPPTSELTSEQPHRRDHP